MNWAPSARAEGRELELEEGARTGGASADWEKQRKELLCWAERSDQRELHGGVTAMTSGHGGNRTPAGWYSTEVTREIRLERCTRIETNA